MSVELDVDAACGASFALDSFEEKGKLQERHFHQSIFVPPYYPVQFAPLAASDFQTQETLKAKAVVADKLEKKITKPGTEVEGSLNFSIGPEGIQFEGAEVRGSASDDRGNHVDVQIDYDHDSRTADVNVGGGHKSD